MQLEMFYDNQNHFGVSMFRGFLYKKKVKYETNRYRIQRLRIILQFTIIIPIFTKILVFIRRQGVTIVRYIDIQKKGRYHKISIFRYLDIDIFLGDITIVVGLE